MPDYGHDLLFGSFVPPDADQPAAVLGMAEQTEALGLDLVSVQDHPYQPAYLDTWTLLSVIAARTSRVTVLPNVANLPLRPPAVLARSAASLDILSGGRVELGLGAGGFWDAIESMGGPRRSPREAVEALDEAITVIRSLWTPGHGVRYSGSHYQLAGTRPGPFPAHPIGIWVGSYKPRMLELTGRLGDGWLPSSPYAAPDELGAMNRRIDDAAQAAGRSPADVRRLYNIVGRFDGDGRTFLEGPPKIWVEQLAELALTEGISGFLLMAPLGGERDLAVFAEEVAPGVRELVAQERSMSGGDSLESASSPVVLREEPEPTVDADGVSGLDVQPTPDDGRRLTTTRLWDESERPTGPVVDPGTAYTEAGRASSRQLIGIHNHLRQELSQIRDLVQQVVDGSMDVGSARSLINTMTMRQNNWTLGAYCESYCRLVTMHHTAEDRMLFPQLRRQDPRLAPVVARLEEEHHVIADVLERVDAALVDVVSQPTDGLAELRHAVDLLTDTLLSHLSYEERELVEPLARLPLRI